jgi:glycosyltransferase involved in cell wall biosynthesis
MAKSSTLLVINVHYRPFLIGGATIVAVGLSELLAREFGWRVIVLTTHQNPQCLPYRITRYRIGNIEVFSIVTPEEGALSYEERYNNPGVTAAFSRIVDRIPFDLAHVHSIQNLGIGVLEALWSRGIPYVTTVHDCWWLSETLFHPGTTPPEEPSAAQLHTVTSDTQRRHSGEDFGQYRAEARRRLLRETLEHSARLLFPSQAHRALYQAQGVQHPYCILNRNGVRLPTAKDPPRAGTARAQHNSSTPIRFGFVGGPNPIKGAPLIARSLRALEASNYELIVVDAAQQRGLTWSRQFRWRINGTLRLVPPYSPESLDTFFDQIDVLLCPSQVHESFGLTVREALVRGVWVIATDAGGLAEDCTNGFNATIIPMTADHRPLQDAIGAILCAGSAPRAAAPLRLTSVEDQAHSVHRLLLDVLAERQPSQKP